MEYPLTVNPLLEKHRFEHHNDDVPWVTGVDIDLDGHATHFMTRTNGRVQKIILVDVGGVQELTKGDAHGPVLPNPAVPRSDSLSSST